jgi:hypothetical protein
MQDDTITSNTDDDVFVWGAEAIGEEIGVDERKARHLLISGLIPAKKVGRVYVSTKRQLREAVTPDGEAS